MTDTTDVPPLMLDDVALARGESGVAVAGDGPSRLHVITGLPRSGSTLLGALLRQNPRFVANMSSPLWGLLTGLVDAMGPGNEFALFFSEHQRAAALRGAFAGYLSDPRWAGRAVLIDTNRLWAMTPGVLDALDPTARIIVCVRSLDQIVNSLLRLLARNPLSPSAMVGGTIRNGLFGCVNTLMGHDGVVGTALNLTRSLLSDPRWRERILVIRYGSLVHDPQATLTALYTFLGEPVFAHDPEHLPPDDPLYEAFDRVRVNTPGLHHVPARLHQDSLNPPMLLPEATRQELLGQNFWEAPGFGPLRIV